MPYLQHGRRHGPNGSDPIPALSEWIVASGSASVASPGPQTWVDLTSWAASSGDNYDIELGSGGLAAIHGIRIILAGVYKVSWYVEIAGINGDTIKANSNDTPGILSTWRAASNPGVYDQVTLSATANRMEFGQLIFVGGVLGAGLADPPQFMFPSVQAATSSSAFTADVAVLIERLSTTHISNLSAGSAP